MARICLAVVVVFPLPHQAHALPAESGLEGYSRLVWETQEMKRVVASRRQHPVHGDEILDATDLGAENDFVARQTMALNRFRGLERADDKWRSS